MRIALAQVPHPTSFAAGLEAVRKGIAAAAAAGAGLVCFPECSLKGMRGTGFPVDALTREEHHLALAEVRGRPRTASTWCCPPSGPRTAPGRTAPTWRRPAGPPRTGR